MKVIILSDIHANFTALKTAVKNFGEYGMIISLGDIIGYGPNPVECIDWVKKNADISVKGNHDSALCSDKDLNYFNEYARKVINICREIIPDSMAEYVCNLPLTAEYDDFYFVHANPYSPDSWEYIMSKSRIYYTLKGQKYKMTFIGHSHVPFIAELIGNEIELYKEKVEIKPNAKYLVNAGSIGQPRDGDNRLSYVVLDRDKNTLEIERLKYDIYKTQDMMREMELPDFLIERLEYGR
ncbi:MAG: hypothetical protein GWP03_01515 [Proteobacteria bacterium]|nr:hypothetical protein [Pseudomonadota bacterium]